MQDFKEWRVMKEVHNFSGVNLGGKGIDAAMRRTRMAMADQLESLLQDGDVAPGTPIQEVIVFLRKSGEPSDRNAAQ